MDRAKMAGVVVFRQLKRQVIRLDKTQKQAAEALGISPVYFSYCLNGHMKPSKDLMERALEKAREWAKQPASRLT